MVLHNTIGAIFIGALLSTTLYGVSCAQIYYYFDHYRKDPGYLKLLVFLVWAFDSVHQALITHSLYVYGITNYSNDLVLSRLISTLIIQFLFIALTALLVQSFFICRVWKLSNKNHILSGTIMAMAVADFVCIILYIARALRLQTFAQLDQFNHLMLAANVLSAAPNVSIAASLCFFTVFKSNASTSHRETNRPSRILSFCLDTTLLISLCSLAMMVTAISLPDSLTYISFLFVLSRLYLNSLLAALNGRRHIDPTSGSRNEKYSLPYQRSRATMVAPTPGNIAIRIDTVQEYANDDGSAFDDPFKTASPSHAGHE